MTKQHDRVHQAIRGALYTHNWPKVTYPVHPTSRFGVRTTSEEIAGTPPIPAVTCKPNGLLLKPMEVTFRVPEVFRMGVKRERDTWEWLALVSFPYEVSTEDFEEQMMSAPILLPRLGVLRQVWIFLTSVVPTLPVEQNASAGASFEMRFQAQENLI